MASEVNCAAHLIPDPTTTKDPLRRRRVGFSKRSEKHVQKKKTRMIVEYRQYIQDFNTKFQNHLLCQN